MGNIYKSKENELDYYRSKADKLIYKLSVQIRQAKKQTKRRFDSTTKHINGIVKELDKITMITDRLTNKLGYKKRTKITYGEVVKIKLKKRNSITNASEDNCEIKS